MVDTSSSDEHEDLTVAQASPGLVLQRPVVQLRVRECCLRVRGGCLGVRHVSYVSPAVFRSNVDESTHSPQLVDSVDESLKDELEDMNASTAS